MLYPKGGAAMSEQTAKNVYDDGNIPKVDLTSDEKSGNVYPAEPLPEFSDWRKRYGSLSNRAEENAAGIYESAQ